MSNEKQCAIVLWHESQQIKSTSLDVLPYQHRYIGAETIIGGHKAKIVAIRGKKKRLIANAFINFVTGLLFCALQLNYS